MAADRVRGPLSDAASGVGSPLSDLHANADGMAERAFTH